MTRREKTVNWLFRIMLISLVLVFMPFVSDVVRAVVILTFFVSNLMMSLMAYGLCRKELRREASESEQMAEESQQVEQELATNSGEDSHA